MKRTQDHSLAPESEAAVALIRLGHGRETRWLARWNHRWSAFNLISAKKWSDESFRECLLREIDEELGLREGVDYDWPAESAAHVEFTAFSHAAGIETRYKMELFEVELRVESALPAIDVAPTNRWLREAEVRAERTSDDRPVSATMKRLLEQIYRAS
jgi:hypothetical protein